MAIKRVRSCGRGEPLHDKLDGEVYSLPRGWSRKKKRFYIFKMAKSLNYNLYVQKKRKFAVLILKTKIPQRSRKIIPAFVRSLTTLDAGASVRVP